VLTRCWFPTGLGSVNSSGASCWCSIPVKITRQPASQTVTVDSSVTFSVTATGNPPPTYQWRLNGVNISGALGSDLSLDESAIDELRTLQRRREKCDRRRQQRFCRAGGAQPNFAVPRRFCATVFVTNSLVGIGSGNNSAATKEPNEPDHAGKPGSKSVWYGWRAPTNGIAIFSTRGSGFDTVLSSLYRTLRLGFPNFATLWSRG